MSNARRVLYHHELKQSSLAEAFMGSPYQSQNEHLFSRPLTSKQPSYRHFRRTKSYLRAYANAVSNSTLNKTLGI